MSDSVQMTGQRRALLVGINHYLDDFIGNLHYCVNDITERNEVLSDNVRGNFTTQPLYSEISERKFIPTRSNIMS